MDKHEEELGVFLYELSSNLTSPGHTEHFQISIRHRGRERGRETGRQTEREGGERGRETETKGDIGGERERVLSN